MHSLTFIPACESVLLLVSKPSVSLSASLETHTQTSVWICRLTTYSLSKRISDRGYVFLGLRAHGAHVYHTSENLRVCLFQNDCMCLHVHLFQNLFICSRLT